MANAKMYYVEDFDLSIGILDGIILSIEKGKHPYVISIVVDALDATFDAVHAADDRLYLDGFALTDLMAWLYREMPNTTFKAFGRRLYRFFPGSAWISDLMRATIRCATGTEHQANGEDANYCRMVRNAHPDEFAELRATWSGRLN